MEMAALSMTGFGRASTETAVGVITCEVRSVNHRFSEVSVRIQREFSALEEQVRQTVFRKLLRGRAEVSILIEQRASSQEAAVDWALLAALLRAEEAIEQETGAAAGASAYQWLQYPGVISVGRPEVDAQTVWPALEPVLQAACASWNESRAREGVRLAADLERKCELIRDCLAVLKGRIPEFLANHKATLRTRVEALGHQVDDARMWTEMALMMDKLSIDEEVTRLDSHLAEFDVSLHGEGAVGRRLDFLIQELHREVNTIGSKSADVVVSRSVVDLKTLIEQMREQVQNIA